jgi:hypothetical protein
MILVAYIVIVLRFIIPAHEILGHYSVWDSASLVFMVSPLLLGVLVMIFERPGPLKNWWVSFLNLLFFPALVLNHDVVSLLNYVQHGRAPALLPALLLNGMVLAFVLVFRDRLFLGSCPNCRRWTLIPLMRLFKNEERSSNTCWCAACGSKYWKDREGNWRPERRKTWVDGPEEPAPAAPPAQAPAPASAIRGPSSLEIADRPVAGSATNEVRAS